MTDPQKQLVPALSAPNPQQRLQAGLDIGIRADRRDLDALVRRCAVEPDFFVRDMLTWALTRLPADETVPRLVAALDSSVPQELAQALHTLSKIGDRRGWRAQDPSRIGDRLIAHPDTEVARSAWRCAVALVPGDDRDDLADVLVTQLGRGDVETQKSLSRAIVALGEDLVSVLDEKLLSEDETVRAHAMATREIDRKSVV